MSNHLVRPILRHDRHPFRLLLAQLVLIEPSHGLEPLVPLQTKRYVMRPGLEPLVMPLAEDGPLIDETVTLEKRVEPARESVAVDVEDVFIAEGVGLFSVFLNLKELLLRAAVARVALAYVGEVDVHEMFVFAAVDFLGRPFGLLVGAGVDEDLGGVGGVDFGDEALAVLAAPAAVATEAAGCGAAPVELVGLGGPGGVFGLVVGDLVGPVPGRGVDDVGVGGDLALGEDGEEVVDDVEGVGAVEEAKGLAEGGGEADVGHGGGVVDEAEVADGVFADVVEALVVFDCAGGAVRGAGHAGVDPCWLMGEDVEAGKRGAVEFGAVVEALGLLGEFVLGGGDGVGGGHVDVLGAVDQPDHVVVGDNHTGLVVDVEGEVHIGEIADEGLEHPPCGIQLPVTTALGVGDVAPAYGDSHEVIVEAQCLLRPVSRRLGLEPPERRHQLVDDVELVYQLDLSLRRERPPLVEARGWVDAISSSVFGHGLVECS